MQNSRSCEKNPHTSEHNSARTRVSVAAAAAAVVVVLRSLVSVVDVVALWSPLSSWSSSFSSSSPFGPHLAFTSTTARLKSRGGGPLIRSIALFCALKSFVSFLALVFYLDSDPAVRV
ncbi:MAG TPA: hypothetical protein EYP98_20425 [Planctomycetes bacterium]|nr:hypothetical protein [Planctomycetota bacterium]